MARIQWAGQSYTAQPKQKLANGDWLMEAREKGPRFDVGTVIRVTQNEIIEMSAAEMPAEPVGDPAATKVRTANVAQAETFQAQDLAHAAPGAGDTDAGTA